MQETVIQPEVINALKIFGPAALAFFLGIALAHPWIKIFCRYEMWKKRARNEALGGGGTPIFNKLHSKREVGTPRLGGVVIWTTVFAATILMFLVARGFPGDLTRKLDFLSRNQTWLPLFTLFFGALVGLADDILQIRGRGGYIAGGLPLRTRIILVLAIGAIGGWWFFAKLGKSAISVPFAGPYDLGIFVIPFFMLVMLALFSGGVIDGIDGLAGGIMATIFSAYAGIAFFQNQIDLAAFSAVVVGAILAFLWYNITPARFYMGESGMLGLTATLSVVAFLTDSVVELLLIALPLFAASGSDIIQLLSKHIRGKKVFLVAPIHHHFEALGWPPEKVTMRFWVLSVIFAMMGMVIALIG